MKRLEIGPADSPPQRLRQHHAAGGNRFQMAGRLLMGPLILLLASRAGASDVTIEVHADRVIGQASRHLTGTCLEDVNHEVYGGIYSQMLYGESFQEPGASGGFKGLTAIDGDWKPTAEGVVVDGGPGPKLVADDVSLASGEASVEVRFADNQPGNAGLLVNVNQAKAGADSFIGYEVSLEPSGMLVFGRHRRNWEPIRTVPCKVALNQWIKLSVKTGDRSIEAFVDGVSVLKYEDSERPLPPGSIALRAWHRPAEFRNLAVIANGQTRAFTFERSHPAVEGGVSGMWKPVAIGTAEGRFALVTDHPFVGTQSQQVTFTRGRGEVGIENRGLNQWGLSFIAGKPYEGHLWLKCERDTPVYVAAQSEDGARTYAQARLDARVGDWQRCDFTLTPSTTDPNARFSIRLKAPGSVAVGYAFLQPGEWGRFKGLPVRKDVADALVAEGLTVMRYGGSMINDPAYRWKKMIGPRDRRPPYKGTWYPYSSNGFGIIEFLNFCEAAGFLAIPDLDDNESPQDIADFIEYVNGPADSAWGRLRAQDGHPAPFGVQYIELGNEEAVDEVYWQKFKPLAEAIWAKDPSVTPVVGDFAYGKPITDPYHFTGAPRITTLATHKKILDFAKSRNKPVWFDVHIGNDRPRDPGPQIEVLRQFIDWLGKLSPGADYKVCVFEENANNHTFRRALAHALTVDRLMRLGAARVPIVCAANCLQCDGQNDNGWDQGLLFLSPSTVWPQPSYYVTQMIARNALPRLVETSVSDNPGDAIDAVARASNDGTLLTLQVTNVSDRPQLTTLHLGGFRPSGAAELTEITGPLDAVNTAADPHRVTPTQRAWSAEFHDSTASYTFPARSFTILRCRR
jgi:alpha-L-arabinofuranosidase